MMSHFWKLVPSTTRQKRMTALFFSALIIFGFYGYLFSYVKNIYPVHVPDEYLAEDVFHPWHEDPRYVVAGFNKDILGIPPYVPLEISITAYSKETSDTFYEKPYEGALGITTVKTFVYIDPSLMREHVLRFLHGPFFGINVSSSSLSEWDMVIDKGAEVKVMSFYGIQEREEGYFVKNAVFRVLGFYGTCTRSGTNFAGVGIALVDIGTSADEFSIGSYSLSYFIHRQTYDESTFQEINSTLIPNMRCAP